MGKRERISSLFFILFSFSRCCCCYCGNCEWDESEEIHSIIRFLPITTALNASDQPIMPPPGGVHKHLVVHARTAIKGPRKLTVGAGSAPSGLIILLCVALCQSWFVFYLVAWWDLDLSECAHSPSSSYRRTSVSLKNREKERGIALIAQDFFKKLAVPFAAFFFCRVHYWWRRMIAFLDAFHVGAISFLPKNQFRIKWKEHNPQ